jgi:hypothetical protein
VAVFVAAPATATTPPRPTPCYAEYVTDDPGDAFFEPTGLGTLNSNFNKLGHAATAQTDVTGLFFTTAKDSKGKTLVYANLQLAQADTAIPPVTDAAGGTQLYVIYNWNGASYYVSATNQDGSGFTYGFGTADPANFSFSGSQGTTPGTLFPGQNGIIQIQIPTTKGGKVGQTLEAASASTFYVQTPPQSPSGLVSTVDVGPNSGTGFNPNGNDYVAGSCDPQPV